MNAIRRPQRELTDADWAAIHAVQTLSLHRMRHLGLVDPVPNPSPMDEEVGAWVREHVWPAFLHHIDDGYAFGFWRWSYCEKGTCWNCLAGDCSTCMHRQKGRPDACDNTATVHGHRGRRVADLILRPGGEPCVWWCRCPCPKTGPAPARQPAATRPAARSEPTRPSGTPRAGRGQPALPGL